MARIVSTLFVPRRLEDVFAFLNTPESHAAFIPNMAEFYQSSPGPFGKIGARARGRLSYLGLVKINVDYEIIEYVLDQRLAMDGKMGPVLFKDGYILRESGNGTDIQFWLELMPTGWAKLLSPLMGLIGRIHAWETLKNLKRELMKKEIVSPLHPS